MPNMKFDKRIKNKWNLQAMSNKLSFSFKTLWHREWLAIVLSQGILIKVPAQTNRKL